MSKVKVYFKSMVGSSVVMLGTSFGDLSSSGKKDGFGLVVRSFVGAETLSYAEVVRSAGSSSVKKIGSLDHTGVAQGFDHFSLEVSEEIEVVRSAVNCFNLEKQSLGPLDKNHPEEVRLSDPLYLRFGKLNVVRCRGRREGLLDPSIVEKPTNWTTRQEPS